MCTLTVWIIIQKNVCLFQLAQFEDLMLFSVTCQLTWHNQGLKLEIGNCEAYFSLICWHFMLIDNNKMISCVLCVWFLCNNITSSTFMTEQKLNQTSPSWWGMHDKIEVVCHSESSLSVRHQGNLNKGSESITYW